MKLKNVRYLVIEGSEALASIYVFRYISKDKHALIYMKSTLEGEKFYPEALVENTKEFDGSGIWDDAAPITKEMLLKILFKDYWWKR